MLRKALTLGMVFIFALSLLLVSMITCFTLDAEAHPQWWCVDACGNGARYDEPQAGMDCNLDWHSHG